MTCTPTYFSPSTPSELLHFSQKLKLIKTVERRSPNKQEVKVLAAPITFLDPANVRYLWG
jgi:hypothetical protein